MKILITGAYGQLGNELNVLSSQYPEWQFLFTDADTLDITDSKAVELFFQTHLPGVVINCAAYTAVDKAETETETARKINALAPEILAKYSKKYGAKFIHISTDYVFDGNTCTPMKETDTENPASVYGATKREGEKLAQAENPGMIIIRTSWLYSTFGNNFVKTMLRLGKEKGSLNVVFDQVGSPTYAADLAGAILSIVKKSEKEPEKFVPGIYHFSDEGVASWYDFAKAIFEIADVNCLVTPVRSAEFPTPARRPAYSVLDKSKIKNTFGIKIPYWRESLITCMKKL